MDPNFSSHTNALVKRIKKHWTLVFLKVYSKRKNLIVYVGQGTKTYARSLEGASCSLKTVSRPYQPQMLWASLWSGGKILLFRVQEHRTNGRILTFHYLQKGWTWLHIPSPITWTEAVHWNQIHCGDITTYTKPYWNISLRSTQPVIAHHVSKKGCKCRFLFPFMSTPFTYIHDDRGDNYKNETLWFCLNGSFNSVYPFMVIPKRPMCCQFINAHNKPISEVFNFKIN